MTKPVINMSIFLIATPISFAFAGNGMPVLALCTAAAVCAFLLRTVPVPAKEALLLIVVGAVGWTWETLMLNVGLVQFYGQGADAVVAPFWTVAPWVMLATTLNHGLRQSKKSVGTAALTGVVFGLLLLNLGSMTGAVLLNDPLAALIAFCLGAGVLLPLVNLVADTIIDSELFEPARHADRDAAVRMRLPVLEQNLRGASSLQLAPIEIPDRRLSGGGFFPANP